MITQEELIKFVSYNPYTGLFTRIKSKRSDTVGKEIMSVNNTGYIFARINGKKYLGHRLAWVYMYGEIPDGLHIDHINHIRTDNRIENLRLVTNSENHKNRKLEKNSSGHTGICWKKANKNWEVYINSNGERIYLGVYKDLNDAILVRKKAEKQYNFHENHGKKDI